MMLSLLLPLFLATTTAEPAANAPSQTETRQCMRNRDIRGQRATADAGYFVRTWQGWWRNTGPACPGLGTNRMLVSFRPSDTQCSGDIVNAVDQFSQINYGACTLGGWERVDESQVPPPYQPGRP